MAIILHHYEMSPFSQMVRRALAVKGVAWQSVIIPNMAPKPELTPLTGGYRKTPVLQVGADIYCDSAAAIDRIEAEAGPTLFPQPLGQLARVIGGWAGGAFFMATVGAAMGALPEGAIPQPFWDDRNALFGLDRARLAAMNPHLRAQFAAGMAWIDATLRDGRDWLGGGAPGYADLIVHMDLAFTQRFHIALDPNAAREAWAARVSAISETPAATISAADALDVARAATPVATGSVDPASGFGAGQPVTVRTEDPGADPVAGTLLHLSPTAIVIHRDDPAVGTVAVHFPRMGQILRAA